MDYLFINTDELSALMGLPYIQQMTYIRGIRPYMDRKSFIVGIKRRISYQSLAEALYVEPHQGIKSGSPGREQLRRIIKALERAGIVKIQSAGKQLVLKCLLANSYSFDQNKPDTKPTYHTDTFAREEKPATAHNHNDSNKKSDIATNSKADTPHNSVNNLFFLGEKFKKFWDLYPVKANKQNTWEVFQNINPDELLITRIISALNQQVEAINEQKALGQWVPNWCNPTNWLTRRRWEDEIDMIAIKEKSHEKYQPNNAKQPYDVFWESCKGGANFNFDDDDTSQEAFTENVITFPKSNH